MTIDDVCWGQGTELLVVILQSKSDLLEVVGTLCPTTNVRDRGGTRSDMTASYAKHRPKLERISRMKIVSHGLQLGGKFVDPRFQQLAPAR